MVATFPNEALLHGAGVLASPLQVLHHAAAAATGAAPAQVVAATQALAGLAPSLNRAKCCFSVTRSKSAQTQCQEVLGTTQMSPQPDVDTA